MSARGHYSSQRITDLLLIPISAASIITGFVLHSVGKNSPHEVWEVWAMAHVVSSGLFFILGFLHVWHHWGWYKSLFTKGIGKKSRVTLLLTISMMLLFVSGIVLLIAIEGPNSMMGHIHNLIGQLLTILALWHIIKRWKMFLKPKQK